MSIIVDIISRCLKKSYTYPFSEKEEEDPFCALKTTPFGTPEKFVEVLNIGTMLAAIIASMNKLRLFLY